MNPFCIFCCSGIFFSQKKTHFSQWMFPRIGVPQNGWFIMENPIRMDDLGIPLFLETPQCLSYFSPCFSIYHHWLVAIRSRLVPFQSSWIIWITTWHEFASKLHGLCGVWQKTIWKLGKKGMGLEYCSKDKEVLFFLVGLGLLLVRICGVRSCFFVKLDCFCWKQLKIEGWVDNVEGVCFIWVLWSIYYFQNVW